MFTRHNLNQKFIIVPLLIATLFFGLSHTTRAATLTDLQALLLQLQAQLQALQIRQVATIAPREGCIQLSQTLALGATDASTNGQVSKLQRFLWNEGYYTYGAVTGYYGPVTAKAVTAWQLKYQIAFPGVSAYGTVDLTTLKAMRCEVATTPTPTPTPTPTATLLVNGASSATINAGESVNFSWSSTNGNSFKNDSEVVANCPAGSYSFGMNNVPSNRGSVGITTANGSNNVLYTVSAGCTITTIFTVRNTVTGQESRSKATVYVRPVKGLPTINIISPNGGIYWYPGTTAYVNWSTLNIPLTDSQDILVRLRSVQTGQEYNLGSVSNSKRVSSPWAVTVPTTIPLGAYYVEVKTSFNGSSYMDSSDEYIKIVANLPIITPAKPSMGMAWVRNNMSDYKLTVTDVKFINIFVDYTNMPPAGVNIVNVATGNVIWRQTLTTTDGYSGSTVVNIPEYIYSSPGNFGETILEAFGPNKYVYAKSDPFILGQ